MLWKNISASKPLINLHLLRNTVYSYVKTFLTKTMTGFNNVLPDKEGDNFLFFTVYWGVQIYERVTSFVSLWNNYINFGAFFLLFW